MFEQCNTYLGTMISSEQLEIWSHQGAVTTSKNAYASVRRALQSPQASFAGREFDVYLQGSYGNDTNIYAESDVDVVVELTSAFASNKTELPVDQYSKHEVYYSGADYTVEIFRKEVLSHLTNWFGRPNVTNGHRSIKITGDVVRRPVDVVVCLSYRHYRYFHSVNDMLYDAGMKICHGDNPVVNYPELHSAALTLKHQATSGRFKPLVRALKNVRTCMVENGCIDEKTAVSYNLEGWLYNAPNELFVYDMRDRFVRACNWLLENGYQGYVMPHRVFNLIGDQNNQWNEEAYKRFCSALIDFDGRYA